MRSNLLISTVLATALPSFFGGTPAAHAQAQTWETDIGPTNVAVSALSRPAFRTAVDTQGNLVVAGVGGDSAASGAQLVWVEKLAADGTSLWYGEWRNPNGRVSLGGLALDGAGHAYVLTTADSTQWRTTCCDSTGGDFQDNVEEQVTVKFDGATGGLLWTSAFTRPASSGISAHHITLDSLGRLVTSGAYSEPYLPNRQYRHVLTTAGQSVWTAVENEAFFEGPCAAAAGGSVVCINSGHALGVYNRDLKVIKYSQTGQVQWSRVIDDKQVNNTAGDLVVDAQDHVIIVGHNTLSNGTCELLRMRLRSKNGQFMWSATSPLATCINNAASSTANTHLGLVPTTNNDYIAIGNLLGSASNVFVRIDRNSGAIEATAIHANAIIARTANGNGEPLVIARGGVGQVLRKIAANNLTILSETLISTGNSSLTAGLAVVPATGRVFVARTLREPVSGERHGLAAAYD